MNQQSPQSPISRIPQPTSRRPPQRHHRAQKYLYLPGFQRQNQPDQPDKIRYLFDTHLHILENIKLADQKSLVIIALNPTILSALYGTKLITLNLQKGWLLIILSFTTVICLLFGLLLAVLVIYPRGERIMKDTTGGEFAIPFKIVGNRKQKTASTITNRILLEIDKKSNNIIIGSHLRKTSDEDLKNFTDEINAISEKDLVDNLCVIVYCRSRVNNIKYLNLRRAILISGIGWIGGLLSLFLVANTN
jgi:hypothetical protein